MVGQIKLEPCCGLSQKKEKTSTLYQIYVKDTFEQRDVDKRTKLIMPLAESYKELEM